MGELEEVTNIFNHYVAKARNKEHLTDDEVTTMLNAFNKKVELEKKQNMANEKTEKIKNIVSSSLKTYFDTNDIVYLTTINICTEEISDNIYKYINENIDNQHKKELQELFNEWYRDLVKIGGDAEHVRIKALREYDVELIEE